MIKSSASNESSVHVRKGHNGWTAETDILDLNGFDWKIITSKWGNYIKSYAQPGEISNKRGYSTFKCSPLKDNSIVLHKASGRATEKAIRMAHQAGLLKFDEHREADVLPRKDPDKFKLAPGQIIFTDGVGYEENRRAIYSIEDRGGSDVAYWVNLDTLALGVDDVFGIRNFDDKFGIGTYYRIGDTLDLDELSNLVVEAKKKEASDRKIAEAEQLVKDQERETKIAEGKALVQIPSWAKGILVAHKKVDVSDSQTDYFDHRTEETLYLLYSPNTRNSFKEMRQAAHSSDLVKHLADAPKDWEHRHNYSMGSGYWLGESHHSGWEIRKGHLDLSENANYDKLYIAAAEGRYFCNTGKPSAGSQTSELACDLSNFKLSKTQHTKHGYDLFVVSVIERVDKETFYEIKSLASDNHGYYSSYNRPGAIPGFQFKQEQFALSFIESLKENGHD